MSEEALRKGQREEIVSSLLDRSGVLVAAIGRDGFRVPMPESLTVTPDRLLPLPENRATMLDLVVPQDGLTVVTAWEAVQAAGLAHTLVRLRHDPKLSLTLTFVDVTESHGVWIAALCDHVTDDTAASESTLAGALAISVRPRTATIYKSALGVISTIDERAGRMLGWTPEQMRGVRSTEFIHPDDQERAVSSWLEMLSKQESMRVRVRHRCADGSWLWVESENIYQPAPDPADAEVITQLSDISDEMATHEALDRREQLLRRLTESVPVGLLQIATDRTLVYANSRLSDMLGIADTQSLEDLRGIVVESDRLALDAALDAALAGYGDGDGFDSELEVRIRPLLTRELRVCAISLVSLSDREGIPGALLCLTDVTESARMREALKYKATFDELTGCHNRASIMATLDDVLTRQDGTLTAVFFVDLDEFKAVNDNRGHGVGDEVLMQTADRLAGVLRRGDAVGRIGGDEFLLISHGLESPEEAMTLADRIGDVLNRPVTLSRGIVELRASVGVACTTFSEPGVDSGELTRRADVAMYESKQTGQGRPVMYARP